MIEALRALAVLAEPPCDHHAAIARALALPAVPGPDEHTSVLVFQVVPYGSVYLGAEGMLGGEARDRIAGFWRALGAEPPDEPDHASVLLAALAALADQDTGDPRVRGARGALYWDHVATWMPPFLGALRRVGSPYYRAWADALDGVLAAEAAVLGPPPGLPRYVCSAPPLGAPADLDELIRIILAPVRVGFVVVRDDLVRCARELGLGLRVGERRFALRSVLAQDPAGVLAWLGAEARRQADAYGEGPIAAWWRDRARRGAAWLDELTLASAADVRPLERHETSAFLDPVAHHENR